MSKHSHTQQVINGAANLAMGAVAASATVVEEKIEKAVDFIGKGKEARATHVIAKTCLAIATYTAVTTFLPFLPFRRTVAVVASCFFVGIYEGVQLASEQKI